MNAFAARWNQITKATEETAATWNATTVAEQNALDMRAAHARNEQVRQWRKMVTKN